MTPFETKTDFCVTGICCVLIKLRFVKVMGIVVFTNEIFFELDHRGAVVFEWLRAP